MRMPKIAGIVVITKEAAIDVSQDTLAENLSSNRTTMKQTSGIRQISRIDGIVAGSEAGIGMVFPPLFAVL